KAEEPAEDRIKLLEAQIKRDPGDVEARLELAGLYASKKDKRADAEENLKAALRMSDDPDQISETAETLAIVRLLDGRSPGWRVMRRIKPGNRKDIIAALSRIRAGKAADIEKMDKGLNDLLGTDPGIEISLRDGILVSLAANILSTGINVSGRKKYREMRSSAAAELETLRQRMKNRTYASPDVKALAETMLEPGAAGKLSDRISADTLDNRKLKSLGRKKTGLRKSIASLRRGVSSIREDLRRSSALFKWYQDFLLWRKGAKETNISVKSLQLKGALEESRNRIKELLLKETDPGVRTKILLQFIKACDEYADDAEVDLAQRGDRSYQAAFELAELLNAYGQDAAFRNAALTAMASFSRKYADSQTRLADSLRAGKTAGSPQYDDWLSLKVISQKIAGLDGKTGWEAVLRLMLAEGYIDAMLNRKENEKRPGAGEDDILIRIKDALNNVDRDKPEQKQAVMGIAERILGNKKVKPFLGKLGKAAAKDDELGGLNEMMLNKGMTKEGFASWVQKRINEIASITDTEDREKAVEEFTRTVASIGPEKTDLVSISQKIEALKDESARISIWLGMARLQSLTDASRISFGMKAIAASQDGNMRRKGITAVSDIIQNMKVFLSKAELSTVLGGAKEQLERADITDAEAAALYGMLTGLRSKVAGAIADDVNAAAARMLEKLVEIRKGSFKERDKQKTERLVALSKAKREQAAQHESGGRFEDARKILEEANKMLNDEVSAAIVLADEGKMEEYAGDVGAVIAEMDAVLGNMRAVLGKMDKLDSNWFISTSRGSVLLAEFYRKNNEPDKSAVHLDKAFQDLEEAERRDPGNANLKMAFSLARAEDSIEKMKAVLGEDHDKALKERERLLSRRNELRGKMTELEAGSERGKQEIAALRI
ncbi:MAG: hypothetical protein PHT95_08220, partial [Candidatus Omnitrophica bacterium]|nr:hypothetical protein [Candidatus Omnitrophota bacterium]